MSKYLVTLIVSLLISGSAAHAYLRSAANNRGDYIEWTRRSIPWHLHEAGSRDVKFESLRRALLLSFQAWTDVECSYISFVEQGVTNVDIVGYWSGLRNLNLMIWRDDSDSWIHDDQTIALTTVTFCSQAGGEECGFVGHVLDADIEFNGRDFAFSTTGDPHRFDVANAATHEIGHMAGLDHSVLAAATMYKKAPEGERIKATLHPDDVEGICAIYPLGKEPAQEDPYDIEGDYILTPQEIEQLENDIQAGPSTTVESCACRMSARPEPTALPLWGLVAWVLGRGLRRRRSRAPRSENSRRRSRSGPPGR